MPQQQNDMFADKSQPRKTRVLIVDDDRLVLATLAKGLRQWGYEVAEASSGEAGLKFALETKPDMVLLDVNMPKMSGLEVARALRAQTSLPFMFLTAYGDSEIVKQAADLGAMGYLVKPVDISQIVPAIEAALARGRELVHLRETETQLSTALASSRETSMAVGILMEREHLDRTAAFELLRDYARSRRRKIGEVAEELLGAIELVNQMRNGKPVAVVSAIERKM
ncbi:MAG: response regulator [Sulfuricella sp.]|nr:response regulator [Sulfuricella sp.]